MKRNSILIAETNLDAKTKEILQKANLLDTESVAAHCYCNDGLQNIEGIGAKREQEIIELLLEEGWKCYPDNYEKLYFKVYGKPTYEGTLLRFFYRSPESNQLFDDVISELDDKKPIVLRQYYGLGCEPLSLGEIAKQLHTTKNKIEVILFWALCKLRQPDKIARFKYFCYSWNDLSKVCARSDKKIQDLKAEVGRLKALAEDNDIPIIKADATSIDGLGLSLRSYNCLKRVGITTIGELARMDYGDFLKIRNLGPRSAKEIIEKLKKKTGFEVEIPNM